MSLIKVRKTKYSGYKWTI